MRSAASRRQPACGGLPPPGKHRPAGRSRDSQRVLRQNAESALGPVGKGKFVRAVNHLAAHTDAAKAVASDGEG